VEMIRSGEIIDSKTALGIYMALEYLQNNPA